MTLKTAVMLRPVALCWSCEPPQTASSGAPVQMLIVQSADPATSPIFFSAMNSAYPAAWDRRAGAEADARSRSGCESVRRPPLCLGAAKHEVAARAAVAPVAAVTAVGEVVAPQAEQPVAAA